MTPATTPATGRRRALLPALALALSLLPACTGSAAPDSSDNDDRGSATPEATPEATATPEVPDTPALPTSPATSGALGGEPAARAQWLLRATGTAESKQLEAEAQGVFVAAGVAVYYAEDTVLGLSLEDGSELWRSPVDLKGGVVRAAGQRPLALADAGADDGTARWTYVSTGGPNRVVTIDVRSGEVLGNQRADVLTQSPMVTDLSGDVPVDYVSTGRGINRINDEAELELIAPAKALGLDEYEVADLAPVPGTGLAVASYEAAAGGERIAGIDLQRGTVLWRRPLTPDGGLPNEVRNRPALYPNLLDGRLYTGEDVDAGRPWFAAAVLDPETGKTVAGGRAKHNYFEGEPFFDFAGNSVAAYETWTQTPVDGDIIVADPREGDLLRVDPRTMKLRWTLEASPLDLEMPDGGRGKIWPGQLTGDGAYLWAMLTNEVAGEILLVDVDDGSIAGRWDMDHEQAAGLGDEPLVAPYGDRLLLARNRGREYSDVDVEPLGPVNDVGAFAFPSADELAGQ